MEVKMATYKFKCGENSNHILNLSQMCRVCPLCGGIGVSEPMPESSIKEFEIESA